MKRVIGFMMFWMGIGMLICVLVRSELFIVILAALLLLIGYNLFSC
ncbi:hypothetical protein [Novisyntrophococcus fermenticellae]|nr:hypothetical protein [Novisyntrophococcus fermenticellae]